MDSDTGFTTNYLLSFAIFCCVLLTYCSQKYFYHVCNERKDLLINVFYNMKIPKITFVYDRNGRATKKNPSSVELCVYAEGKRKYLSTGVRLLPSEWVGHVSSRKDGWRELNEQLELMRDKVMNIVTDMMRDGCMDLNAIPSMLESEMAVKQTFIDYAREYAERRMKKLRHGTCKHYKVMIRFLEEWGKIRYFSDLTTRNIERMDDELERRGLKQNTRWNYHKRMKMFCTKAMDDGLIKKNPYSRADVERGEDYGLLRFLSPEEFHAFETCEIECKRLARVRDLFVFQTYTMMAYSDMAAFAWEKCARKNGKVVYKAHRKKTGQEFVVVLLKPALEVLSRYGNKLPMISNVKYNKYLKEAVGCAGIKKEVTTHWARHTGATLLLNEGKVSMVVVQHILGHASIRETERTYAKVLDETIVNAMSELDDTMG